MVGNEIYLDHGATTPVHPDVIAAMAPYWSDVFGNPSSHHRTGYRAARAVESARSRIAELLSAAPDEIVFTGCGSESNNLALRGAMWAARASGRGNHLITSCVEHSAVLETARQLSATFGFDLSVVPVDSSGRVCVEDIARAIRPDTVLISVMAANNEIGTIQPWEAIGKLARERGVLFHTDAVQLAAARRWNLSTEPVDLMTLAPHKFYGPKGIGILYVRSGTPLLATQTGGGHENGRRAGTVNVPLVVGAAAALSLAMAQQAERVAHLTHLRDRLLKEIPHALPDCCIVTGHPQDRLPHNASFAFKDISANDLLMHLDLAGIAAGSGSACSSGNPKPSPVLEAIGLGREWTKGGLRLTVGTNSTEIEVDRAIPIIIESARRLAQLEASPMPALVG